MKTQYVPDNWPTDCQCTECVNHCNRQKCDGDCRPDCQPEYDCQARVLFELKPCGRVGSK
ncbi:hypothetical protein [Sporomusa sphaeroides]|uniref:hypothetical protein n=1 Tax=Sporomusa sphaeroides TaxID=47679 RepID=UPI0011B218B5|nr:hypothetical protein [Sporomusa sphaeroides]